MKTPHHQLSRFNREKVRRGYELILAGLGFDWKNNPHMHDTPRRASDAMIEEMCDGLFENPPKMTTFPLEGKSEMVVSEGIPVRSLCAHHLLPFVGTAVVAYIPHQKVLGLSKLSRAVDYIAKRPQVQEELTTGVADFLSEVLELGPNGGVAVSVRAKHMCMELRGVKHTSDVTTSALRGEFLSPEVRAEFYSIIRGKNHGS